MDNNKDIIGKLRDSERDDNSINTCLTNYWFDLPFFLPTAYCFSLNQQTELYAIYLFFVLLFFFRCPV